MNWIKTAIRLQQNISLPAKMFRELHQSPCSTCQIMRQSKGQKQLRVVARFRLRDLTVPARSLSLYIYPALVLPMTYPSDI